MRIDVFRKAAGAIVLGALAATLVGTAPAGSTAAPHPLVWPLDRPKDIVSTFGEYRYDRLHAGLDLSTDGAVGLPVKAVGDGAIYRLKVEWRGYGRALYLRLRDGRRIVYGHLDRYEDKALGLEQRVARRRQETGNRFPGDLLFEPGIPVRRGQVVAYTGESGVGPPHLHVEVRDADDHPIDPFAAGLPRPPKGAAPVFDALILTAGDVGSFIEGRQREALLDLRRRGPVFEPDREVSVTGPVDAAVSVWDPVGGGRAGLTGLEVTVDGAPWYRFEPRRFGFSENPMAGLLFDHRFSRLGPARFAYRLGLLAGNALATGAGGTIDLAPGSHVLEVRARAVGGAESVARVRLKVAPPAPPERLAQNPSRPTGDLRLDLLPRFIDLRESDHLGLTYAAAEQAEWSGAILRALGGTSLDLVTRERGVRRDADGFFVDVPAGARFSTGPLVVRALPADPVRAGLSPLAPAVELLPDGESLDAPGRLGFRLPAESPPERAGVYRLDPPSGRWGFEGDRLESGAIVIPFRRYGRFALLRDDAAPVLGDVRPAAGRSVGTRPAFSARVSDIGKGLNWDGVRFEVDGRRILTEYDPDRGLAKAVETPSLAPGRHRLTVTAIDRAGNESLPIAHEFVVRGAAAKAAR